MDFPDFKVAVKTRANMIAIQRLLLQGGAEWSDHKNQGKIRYTFKPFLYLKTFNGKQYIKQGANVYSFVENPLRQLLVEEILSL